MSRWPSTQAKRVYRALTRIGWREAGNPTSGSHRQLAKDGWPNFTWSFHDSEEIGPVMLSRIAKKTGLRSEDL